MRHRGPPVCTARWPFQAAYNQPTDVRPGCPDPAEGGSQRRWGRRRVGLAGQRTKRNETSGLGQRLLHHLDAAYGDQAARKAEFYDHFEFHSALIGHAMTICWMPCAPEGLRRAEHAAIKGAPGGVLWERLPTERLAVASRRTSSQSEGCARSDVIRVHPLAQSCRELHRCWHQPVALAPPIEPQE